MMKRLELLGLVVVVAAAVGTGLALAQSGHHGHGRHDGGANPYAAFKNRLVKALSPEQESDLRNGRGMGLALAAELNGYPGPMHVLQLADTLALSVDQRLRLETLFARMKAEATATGEQIIELESELDKQFVVRSINAASLERLTKDIGEGQGRLRATHLRYHLQTVAILSPEQVAKYNAARGYTR
jgi:Spy/CpxP family protein refolding chaperone